MNNRALCWHDVRGATRIEDELPTVEPGTTAILRTRTAPLHLLGQEIGAIAEIEHGFPRCVAFIPAQLLRGQARLQDWSLT